MWDRPWAVVATVLAALVLVGVGVVLVAGGDDELDPMLVAHSAERTLDAGSARVIFTFAIDAPPGFEDQAVSFGGDGVFDFAAARTLLRIRVTDALGGDGADGQAPGGRNLEIVVADGTTFVKMPLLSEAAGGEFEWFSVDVAELTRVTGESQLGLGASDPRRTIDYLRGATEGLTEIGDEPVAGVGATHYTARVDLTRAVELTPATERAGVQAAADQFADQFGTRQFTVDAWIDGDGLLRRIRYELDLSDFDASGEVPSGAIMSFTMELLDFGVTDPIDVPAPDTVGDLSPLLSRLGGEPEPSGAP